MPSRVIAIDNEGKKRCSFDSINGAKMFYTEPERKALRDEADLLKEGRHIYMYVGSVIKKEIVVQTTVTKVVLEDIIN